MELVELANSVIIFLTHGVFYSENFPTQIPDCDSHSLTLLNCFFFLVLVLLQWLPLHWKILITFLSQFSLTFLQTQREMPFFIPQLMPVLLLIGTVCMIIREMLHERILLNLVLLLLVLTFVRVTLLKLVYISIYHQYQIQPHSSQWLSAACAAAITHRNHFFRLYQQNKYSASKVKFRQASNCAKGFLRLANLLMLVKQKKLSLTKILALVTFSKTLIVLVGKVNLPYLLYLISLICCLLLLIKQNCLQKTFLRTEISVYQTQVSHYVLSLLRPWENDFVFRPSLLDSLFNLTCPRVFLNNK